MRIVGGRHRGRKIIGPEDENDALRPTSDRARESLFNILEHGRFSRDGTSLVRGARVLDVFCGTGAFALEALSRGAAAASLIDKDPAAIALVHRNLTALGETNARVVQADATKPPRATEAHALVFLDPPYRSGLTATALAALDEGGWIAPDALCVAEMERREPFAAPPGFAVLDERSYGRARLVFLRKETA